MSQGEVGPLSQSSPVSFATQQQQQPPKKDLYVPQVDTSVTHIPHSLPQNQTTQHHTLRLTRELM